MLVQSNMPTNLSLFIRNTSLQAPASADHADPWAPFLNVVPYIFILLSIATNISNLVVLAAIFVNRHLRTPFNCYLASLLVSDIGQASFDLPFVIVSTFVPVWSLGRVACNFHLYAKWVFPATIRNTHALISFNRVWALFWPLNYRQYHSKTVAIWLCVGTWMYAHLWLMPGLVPDFMGLRKDDGTCYLNTTAQPIWGITTQLCLHDATLVVIVTSYPFIWWKIRQRQKVAPKSPESNTVKGTAGSVIATSVTIAGVLPQPSQAGPSCVSAGGMELNLFADVKNDDDLSVNHRCKYAPKESAPYTSEGQRKSSQSFTVLTYLVLGVVFCWTPIMTFYTMADFMEYDESVHFIIGSLLYHFNSLLDPFFFCIAIRPLRATVLRVLGYRAKKPLVN